MPIAAVLDASCDLTEAVQEDFIVATVVFIIPGVQSRAPGCEGDDKRASCCSLNDLQQSTGSSLDFLA